MTVARATTLPGVDYYVVVVYDKPQDVCEDGDVRVRTQSYVAKFEFHSDDPDDAHLQAHVLWAKATAAGFDAIVDRVRARR